jgi:hypothetical protein
MARGRNDKDLTDTAYLQTQIDIIRGQRTARPSGQLRELESQVLGERSGRQSLELQRWSHPTLEASVIAASTVSVSVPMGNDGNTNPAALREIVSPFSVGFGPGDNHTEHMHQKPSALSGDGRALCSPFSADFTLTLTKTAIGQSTEDSAVDSPELLAPGQSRFEVEPFEYHEAVDTVSSDEVFGEKFSGQHSSGEAPAESPLVAPLQQLKQAEAAVFSADDGDWITAAQSEQPKEITEASKQSLDTGLSLAKDDFERELAGILGTTPPTPASPSEDNFLQQAATAQTQRAAADVPNPSASTPNAPAGTNNTAAAENSEQEPAPAHPTHDVFDRMGLGLQYANSFDLGQVNINDRFDAIEQSLSAQPILTIPSGATPTTVTPTTAIPTMTPQASANTQSQNTGERATANVFDDPFVTPQDLDDFDLVAELAQIGAIVPGGSGLDPQSVVGANQVQSAPDPVIDAALNPVLNTTVKSAPVERADPLRQEITPSGQAEALLVGAE